MRIVVPTYRRHSNGEAQTFRHLPRDLGVTLAVREEEFDLYRRMLDDLGRAEDVIWRLRRGSVSGIASTRQRIMEMAIDSGEDKICMVDDDLHFIVRGKMEDPEDDVHLRPCGEDDTRSMFEWLDDSLDEYAHAAVSMREGNNRVPGIGAKVETTRGIRCVAYRTDSVYDGVVRFREEVEGREDLDMTLQLLRLGLPNVVTYHWAQGQRSADAPGGLSGVRTADQLDSSAEMLAELHPGLVRTRQKHNKTGAMAGWRTEVTVYWKRALASAGGE